MASGMGNTYAFGALKALFQAVFTDLSTIWQNAGAPATNLYVSLHTANPAATGTQSTSEAAYGAYARQPVARTSGGFTITAETITNAAVINFPACTSGSETETYVGIGTAASGAGILLWFGQLTTPLAVSTGITPSIAASALSITEG
jgi:hypothetical protein